MSRQTRRRTARQIADAARGQSVVVLVVDDDGGDISLDVGYMNLPRSRALQALATAFEGLMAEAMAERGDMEPATGLILRPDPSAVRRFGRGN